MPSTRRALGTVAGLGAAAALLTACEKPLPEITVLSGSTTITVSPQSYCFDTTNCRFPKSEVGTVKAPQGSTLLVDVPRSIAYQTWSITSAVQTKAGVFRTIGGAQYSSGPIRDAHSATLQVPTGVGSSYYLVVRQGGTVSGTWVAEVSITR